MRYQNRRGFGPRERHKITCSQCGKEDTVPFKPREGLPVLCKDCYLKKKGITPRKRFEDEPQEESAEETEEVEESNEEESDDSDEEADEEVEESDEE